VEREILEENRGRETACRGFPRAHEEIATAGLVLMNRYCPSFHGRLLLRLEAGSGKHHITPPRHAVPLKLSRHPDE
jgi:hypothetical protein